jgi:hypothetical protein
MTAILKPKWHGVAALIWWSCGLAVMRAYGPNPWPEDWIVYILLGWIAPVLLLALSGLRRGSIVGAICAVLVLVSFVGVALVYLIPPIPRDGH